MKEKIYTRDLAEFKTNKVQLDGRVFWREIGNNKVEIIPLDIEAETIVKKLKE